MRSFMLNYLTEIKPSASKEDLEREADSLVDETMPFVPCSHLFWSSEYSLSNRKTVILVWAFLQSITSPLSFGFLVSDL